MLTAEQANDRPEADFCEIEKRGYRLFKKRRRVLSGPYCCDHTNDYEKKCTSSRAKKY